MHREPRHLSTLGHSIAQPVLCLPPSLAWLLQARLPPKTKSAVAEQIQACAHSRECKEQWEQQYRNKHLQFRPNSGLPASDAREADARQKGTEQGMDAYRIRSGSGQ